MQLTLTSTYYNTLMELFSIDQHLVIPIDQRPRRKLAFKVGRLAGKVKAFFKRTETKIVSLISYWAFETVLFAIIMLNVTTLSALAAAAFLYIYGTYVIYSAINALTK